MSLLLAPVVEAYRYALQPLAPFAWFGLSFCTLDVAATFRLCIAMRQLKEEFYVQHLAKKAQAGKGAAIQDVEERSFVRDVSATLMAVYGGEAVACPALGIPPSFMISGRVPAFYTAIHAIVSRLPSVPTPSLETELPFAILDGFSRAFLLCSTIPPTVLNHSWPSVADSPWSLLVTSLAIANGGWFFINLFSFLQPYALTLTTPAELLPYGWTTTDLWCAPLITGLFALLTHAQPFWADAHAVLLGWLGGAAGADEKIAPVDAEVARALCATLLAGMFVTRAVKNFSAPSSGLKPVSGPKTKVQ